MIWELSDTYRADPEKKDAVNTVILYVPEKAQLLEAEIQLSDGDFYCRSALCEK